MFCADFLLVLYIIVCILCACALYTGLNNLVLRLVGLRSTEDHSVSEDMLRRVVEEAQRSETGIESEEGARAITLLCVAACG